MFCKNCGEQLPENETKCPKCGADNSSEDLNVSAAGAERAIPRGFSAKKNIIIIIIAAVLLIGGGITAIAVVNSHSASSGVSDKLKLAERFLSEQNYEQAVIEYQKVLEIEPMNVDAYLGLADAYIGLGEGDKAIEILTEGLEKTGDARIQSKINELAAPESSEPANSVESSTSPAYGSMGSVTILGFEYDIAITTGLILCNEGIDDSKLKEIAPQIEKLTNLTMLWLKDNQITDITPLGSLTNLTYLDLGFNQITDITPLGSLTNLTELNLSYNQISDITPLAKLTNLTELYLWGTQISDEDIEQLKSQLPNCNINS